MELQSFGQVAKVLEKNIARVLELLSFGLVAEFLEKNIARVPELQSFGLVAKVLEKNIARVLELHSFGLVVKLSAMVVPTGMVVKKFPSVVVTDDLKSAVIVMEVLTVVVREAPKVVMEGAGVEKDNEIVVEEGVMLEVKVEVKAEVFDMNPKVL
jgi:hypothetical protein